MPLQNSLLLIFHCTAAVGVAVRYDATNATSRQEFLAAVDALDANGGGDCPELGMTGIINALGLSFPEGQLIVLTDASALDSSRTDEAIQAAFMLGVKVHFAFTDEGGCGEGYPFYDRVADETDGFRVYDLTNLETLSYAVQTTRVTFNEADESAGFNLTSVSGCKAIHVSLLTENIYIAINPGALTAEVSLQMPNGTYVFGRMKISSLLVQNFTSPASGKWLVCIYSGSVDVKQSQDIRFDITAEFLVQDETTGLYISNSTPPFTCSEVTAILFTTRHADLSTSQLHTLRFVDINGTDLMDIALLQCNRFLEGRFTLPSVQYRLFFLGFDSGNNSIVSDLGVFPAGPQQGLFVTLSFLSSCAHACMRMHIRTCTCMYAHAHVYHFIHSLYHCLSLCYV